MCDAAFAWWQEWSGQTDGGITGDQQIQLAIDALSVNYRVGKVEILSLLGLWSTDEFSLILRALIDADEIENQLAAAKAKKNTSVAGESNTSSGVTESSPVISPALPT